MKELNCISCGKTVHVIDRKIDAPPESNMWNGAVVDTVVAGYGSMFDEDIFVIAICDNCIETNPNIIRK